MSAGESARAMAQQLRDEADALRSQANDWQAGAVGEERVAAALLAADTKTIRTLHDRLLDPSQSSTNLDHLVVSTAGVYLIDAKNWTGNVTAYRESLWQHWTSADGRQSKNKNAELHKVRGMAAKVGATTGTSVSPVLCLAGDRADQFGTAQVLCGVTVLPIAQLVPWLESQPAVYSPEQVATMAVDVSCRFPPALNPGLTMAIADAAPSREPGHEQRKAAKSTEKGRRPDAQRKRRRKRGSVHLAKFGVGALALLLLLTVGPRLVSALAHGLTNAIVRTAATTNAPRPSGPKLSAARAQELDDWRIRAGLYESNDQPGALVYVPDAALGSWSQTCQKQESKLGPFRAALLAAPDPLLKPAAARFDSGAQALLKACVHNDAVGLHHARVAMAAAAAAINDRYNHLLGTPQTGYGSKQVL